MFLIVGVDDYSSESDVIIIPSALDFVSQDEMLTPLGRLDKYVASENVFNRYKIFCYQFMPFYFSIASLFLPITLVNMRCNFSYITVPL